MRFLADENCSFTLISVLIAAGHDVNSIVRTMPGTDDDSVFALAKHENRVLLTHDRGFGRIAEQADERPPAIVLMRLRGMNSRSSAPIVVQAISDLGESIMGNVVVIEPASIRSRPYKD
jgi:predicted nuclease of predicted toxin-antitoxin system